MKPLLWANLLVGVFAVCLVAIVLYGHVRIALSQFREGLRPWREWTAGDRMRVAITIFHLKTFLRLLLWDGIMLWILWARTDWAAAVNLFFSLLVIAASLVSLSAMYKNIPPSQRKGYTWLSAPWHPTVPPWRHFWF